MKRFIFASIALLLLFTGTSAQNINNPRYAIIKSAKIPAELIDDLQELPRHEERIDELELANPEQAGYFYPSINPEKIDIEEQIHPDRDKYLRNYPGREKLDIASKGDDTYVSEADSLALVALYYSTNGDNWNDNSNWLTGPVYSWYGIEVNSGQVTRVNLESNNLAGSLPPEIGNLVNLNHLYLRNNYLTGTIPQEIGNLTSLYYLELFWNNLSGPIPVEISFLSNLWVLGLSGNDFTGVIPTQLGNLSNLGYLDLDWNKLTGSIPGELYSISNLRAMSLNNNDLSGTIPPGISTLTNLSYLNLNGNMFDGSIPAEIGNMISLNNLNLSDNEFTGSVPPELNNLTNLTSFYISNNSLDELPVLSSLNNLVYVHLNNNNFTFGDLQNAGIVSSVDYEYSPQNSIPQPDQTDNGNNTTTLSILTDGAGNTYQWYNDQTLIDGETSNEITVNNSDEGIYICKISNPGFPDLVLESEPVFFNITIINGVIEDEYNALVEFYNSFNGDNWYDNTNWLTETDVSSWYGISTENKRVTSISLYNNNLTGSIPASIGDFRLLAILHLPQNNITGNLPVEIGNLKFLETLSLYNNSIDGLFINEIGNLSNLSTLALSSNLLSGTIPDIFSGLPGLSNLRLDNNQFTGSFPGSISSLNNLSTMTLNNNNLSGELPIDIGQLFNLSTLNLSYNSFSGGIPAGIGDIPYLYRLDLSHNQLSGGIPITLGNLYNLRYMYLNHNELSGSIPSELGNLASIITLYIYYNQFTGSVPAELGLLPSLTYFAVCNNQLDALPDLTGLTSLQYLYLYDNYFSFGDLENTGLDFISGTEAISYTPQKELDKPAETPSGDDIILTVSTDGTGDTYQWYSDGLVMGEETNSELTISNSETGIFYCQVLNSSFPDLILSTSPVYLNVNNTHGIVENEYNALVSLYNSTNGENWANNTNWLSDEDVSTWYGIISNEGHVKEIRLYDNNLSGTIPTDIGEFERLVNFNMRDNSITGSIPVEIGNLSNLVFLILHSNQLSGPMPAEIGNLTQLLYLYLYNNQLSGSIPAEIGNLTNLVYLHLYENNLSGILPPEIGNLTNLQELFLWMNQFEGNIPPEIGNLSSITKLNLYLNNFSGSIPAEIGNLTTLYRMDLDENNLSGEVPPELGNLTNLETLYLCYNNLSGSLPSEFNNLTNLSTLYINDNEFTNLPGLLNLGLLTYFPTDDNRFTFEDFENTGLDISSMTYAPYSPQSALELTTPDIYAEFGDDAVVNCQNLTIDNLSNPNNEYSLYKDSGTKGYDLVSDWSSSPEFIISSFGASDEGDYIMKVRNNEYPDLILTTEVLTISISSVNNAPTNIWISSDNVDESAAIGTMVGELSTTDPDSGDSHTYSLVIGDGSNDADNSSFTIEGNLLKTAESLDYEIKTEYYIYVETEDDGGLSYEKAFVIYVNDEVETNVTEISSLSIKVYPNPSSGIFKIEANKHGSRLVIFDLTGRKVQDILMLSNTEEIDISDCPEGIYIINVSNGLENYRQQFIIK